MGNPDLSQHEQPPPPGSGLRPRGLVVFPAPARVRHQNLLARYAPFLVTVALGAVLVVVVALVSY